MDKQNHSNKIFFIIAGCFLLLYCLWNIWQIVEPFIFPSGIRISDFVQALIFATILLTLSILLLFRKNNIAIFIFLVILGLIETYSLLSVVIFLIKDLHVYWQHSVFYLLSILSNAFDLVAVVLLAFFSLISRINKQSNIRKVWFLPAILQLINLIIMFIQYKTLSISLSFIAYVSIALKSSLYIVAFVFMGLALTNKAQLSQGKLPA